MYTLNIRTREIPLAFALKNNLIENVKIENEPIIAGRDNESDLFVNIIISFAVSVPAGVIANWIFSKIRKKDGTIIINRKEIQIDEGEIKKIIEEEIKIQQ